MKRVPELKYKLIKRVSPSQLYAMKQCPYKMVLAEAFNRQPLLPFSPAAYFGTVLHKLLELIAKGQISNNDEFDREFSTGILAAEDGLQKHGFGFFVPLHNCVRDFGLKKLQARKHLFISRAGGNGYSVASEKWLSSTDNTIGGKLDLLIEANSYVEIIDLKTGAITESSLDDEGEEVVSIKEEYQTQLKLYAQLYFENFARYPDALAVVGLNKDKYPIQFAPVECEAIYQEAKSLLETTNRNIEEKLFKANPGEDTCKYCLYRPACSFYRLFMLSAVNVNDVTGKISKVAKYLNGNVSVWLADSGKTSHVMALGQEFFTHLNSSIGSTISIYNLRKTGKESTYTTTKTTMIYVQ